MEVPGLLLAVVGRDTVLLGSVDWGLVMAAVTAARSAAAAMRGIALASQCTISLTEGGKGGKEREGEIWGGRRRSGDQVAGLLIHKLNTRRKERSRNDTLLYPC